MAVPRERLERWLQNFATRHGDPLATVHAPDSFHDQEDAPDQPTAPDQQQVVLTAPDGAVARIHVPFPPLAESADPASELITHAAVDRRVAVVLVRRGGHAVGVFEGAELITSKVGNRYVQGRTKAGGWSQQRFARRRDNQARKAWQGAADDAATHLAGEHERAVTLVAGGDRTGVLAVLDDPRLRRLRTLWRAGGAVVLPVDDPRQRVLAAFAEQFLAVTVELNDRA